MRVGLPRARPVRARRSVPGIQMNVPAIYHNALPPNITPSSSPGTLSTSTWYDCWRSISTLPLWAPSWPPTSKSKNPPLVCDGPLKWPHRRVGVLNPNSRGHTKARENFARRARRANVLSVICGASQAQWTGSGVAAVLLSWAVLPVPRLQRPACVAANGQGTLREMTHVCNRHTALPRTIALRFPVPPATPLCVAVGPFSGEGVAEFSLTIQHLPGGGGSDIPPLPPPLGPPPLRDSAVG